jgi:hypothetical protein
MSAAFSPIMIGREAGHRDLGGPTRAVAGVVGEAGDCGAQAVVASPSEDDAAAFAGGVGDGTDAGLGGELVVALDKARRYLSENPTGRVSA